MSRFSGVSAIAGFVCVSAALIPALGAQGAAADAIPNGPPATIFCRRRRGPAR